MCYGLIALYSLVIPTSLRPSLFTHSLTLCLSNYSIPITTPPFFLFSRHVTFFVAIPGLSSSSRFAWIGAAKAVHSMMRALLCHLVCRTLAITIPDLCVQDERARGALEKQRDARKKRWIQIYAHSSQPNRTN